MANQMPSSARALRDQVVKSTKDAKARQLMTGYRVLRFSTRS